MRRGVLAAVLAAVLGLGLCACVEPGNGLVVVTWSPFEDLGIANRHLVDRYIVTDTATGAAIQVPADTTSVVVPGLRNGTTYCFTVSAHLHDGSVRTAVASRWPQCATPSAGDDDPPTLDLAQDVVTLPRHGAFTLEATSRSSMHESLRLLAIGTGTLSSSLPLPRGFRFEDHGNGHATLSGRPADDCYAIHVIATDGHLAGVVARTVYIDVGRTDCPHTWHA